MKKHISFPSIEQFRHVVTSVNRTHSFVGLDDKGEAIYDNSRPKPVLTFKGTVKLHGTNMGVCYNQVDGIWAQSRENIITPEKDNAGSAFFVKANEDAFLGLFDHVKDRYNIDTVNNTISIYGEWAGRGIQKGVAVSELDKSMFIFGVKITPHESYENPKVSAYWVDSSFLSNPERRIYNIEDFKTYSVDIDFNMPQLSQNKIIDMTLEVEEECPVSKAFGVAGIGEGIVFSYTYEDGTRLIFKSKGEKHSSGSKVKTLKPVDDEKLAKVVEIADKVTPEWRLAQMLEKTFDLMNGGSLDIKQTGNFIKNVMGDIVKEEADVLNENAMVPKDISGKVAEICKNYLFAKLNEEAGLK